MCSSDLCKKQSRCARTLHHLWELQAEREAGAGRVVGLEEVAVVNHVEG
jgi:hypothetical protein